MLLHAWAVRLSLLLPMLQHALWQVPVRRQATRLAHHVPAVMRMRRLPAAPQVPGQRGGVRRIGQQDPHEQARRLAVDRRHLGKHVHVVHMRARLAGQQAAGHRCG